MVQLPNFKQYVNYIANLFKRKLTKSQDVNSAINNKFTGLDGLKHLFQEYNTTHCLGSNHTLAQPSIQLDYFKSDNKGHLFSLVMLLVNSPF